MSLWATCRGWAAWRDHTDTLVWPRGSTALFREAFGVTQLRDFLPRRGAFIRARRKAAASCTPAFPLCPLEMKLWGNYFVLQAPPESEQISTINISIKIQVMNSAIATCPDVRQSVFLTGQLSHYQHYSDKQIKIRAKQRQSQNLHW